MSNHRLDRSSIECGRSPWWKSETRFSHRKNRQKTRRLLELATHDVSLTDQLVKKQSWMDLGLVDDKFQCKTRIIRDWLTTQVGRVWNEVRSDIFHRFGGQSFRKYHLRDHLLYLVSESPFDCSRRYPNFRVDEHGVLCEGSDLEPTVPKLRTFPKPPKEWAPYHRNVGPDGKKLSRYRDDRVWAIVNIHGDPHWVRAKEWVKEVDETGKIVYYPTVYAHVRAFSSEETDYLRSLPNFAYNRLFLETIKRSRRQENRGRRFHRGFPFLPEITLVD